MSGTDGRGAGQFSILKEEVVRFGFEIVGLQCVCELQKATSTLELEFGTVGTSKGTNAVSSFAFLTFCSNS